MQVHLHQIRGIMIIRKILCLIGFHYWINVDGKGLAGEHRCKFCNKLGWDAIKWPKRRHISKEKVDYKALGNFKNRQEVDEILLKNGFNYYDDWEYGLMYSWLGDHDVMSLRLIHFTLGYWIIFHRHAGGENFDMNIGESNDADQIVKLKDLLVSVADGHLTRKSIEIGNNI